MVHNVTKAYNCMQTGPVDKNIYKNKFQSNQADLWTQYARCTGGTGLLQNTCIQGYLKLFRLYMSIILMIFFFLKQLTNFLMILMEMTEVHVDPWRGWIVKFMSNALMVLILVYFLLF